MTNGGTRASWTTAVAVRWPARRKKGRPQTAYCGAKLTPRA
jgi:hypothetical protein